MEDHHLWEAIDKVNENDIQQKDQENNLISLEKATELSVWLHTEF